MRVKTLFVLFVAISIIASVAALSSESEKVAKIVSSKNKDEPQDSKPNENVEPEKSIDDTQKTIDKESTQAVAAAKAEDNKNSEEKENQKQEKQEKQEKPQPSDASAQTAQHIGPAPNPVAVTVISPAPRNGEIPSAIARKYAARNSRLRNKDKWTEASDDSGKSDSNVEEEEEEEEEDTTKAETSHHNRHHPHNRHQHNVRSFCCRLTETGQYVGPCCSAQHISPVDKYQEWLDSVNGGSGSMPYVGGFKPAWNRESRRDREADLDQIVAHAPNKINSPQMKCVMCQFFVEKVDLFYRTGAENSPIFLEKKNSFKRSKKNAIRTEVTEMNPDVDKWSTNIEYVDHVDQTHQNIPLSNFHHENTPDEAFSFLEEKKLVKPRILPRSHVAPSTDGKMRLRSHKSKVNSMAKAKGFDFNMFVGGGLGGVAKGIAGMAGGNDKVQGLIGGIFNTVGAIGGAVQQIIPKAGGGGDAPAPSPPKVPVAPPLPPPPPKIYIVSTPAPAPPLPTIYQLPPEADFDQPLMDGTEAKTNAEVNDDNEQEGEFSDIIDSTVNHAGRSDLSDTEVRRMQKLRLILGDLPPIGTSKSLAKLGKDLFIKMKPLVKHKLGVMCKAKLPYSELDFCKPLYSQHFETITTQLRSGTDPLEICQQISYCSKLQTSPLPRK